MRHGVDKATIERAKTEKPITMAALGLIFTAPLAFSQSFIRSIQATDRSKGQGPIASTLEGLRLYRPFANNPGWGIFGSSLME